MPAAESSDDEDDARADGARATPTAKKRRAAAAAAAEEDDEDAAFANTLSRGLQSGHDARATTRVADREGQQRFQDALHAVANAFRACKRSGRTRDAEVANAVELVRDAHDRLPSEMRIPAESPYEKLMRYTRHLTQRVGVRDDMSKNLPESTVRAIEDAANALAESVPEAMNKSDGRNAITSLNALKLTLDRTRGASSSKAGSAWDDKATRCKDVAQALLNVTEADTKVTMHSQYLGGPMHALDAFASDQLTEMSHDEKTTDAQYLWRVLRAFSQALFEQHSVDSFIAKAIPSSLQKEARDFFKNRTSKDCALDTLVKRVKLFPALVIAAYGSMSSDKVTKIREVLSNPVEVALPTSIQFMKIHGHALAPSANDVLFVQRATTEQIARLNRAGIPFHASITRQEANAALEGAEQHIKWEEDNAPQSHALLQSLSSSPIPSLPVPPASSVFERLGEKVQVKKTKTQLKAETTKDFKHSKRCKICDHTVHAPTPTSLANVWAQHQTSKMHKAAVQAKKDAKNTPQQAPHPLASLAPVERAYAQMVDVPPPPTSMAKGENQGDVRIMKAQITQATEVPPPPPEGCARALGFQYKNAGVSHPLEKLWVPGEEGEVVSRSSTETHVGAMNNGARYGDVVGRQIQQRLQNVQHQQQTLKRKRIELFARKADPPRRGPVYCKHFDRGNCWNGDACKFRHGRVPDSPCDSYDG